MAYGTIKVDTITFTDSGVDKSVSISGLVQNPTFSGNITVTGTVSGNTIQGQTVSGVTVTGTTANFTSGNFTTFTGGTITLTSGVIASGTAANPSLSILGDANTGLYSPGADQLAISTSGAQRLVVDASGNVGAGVASPGARLHVLQGATPNIAQLYIGQGGGSSNYYDANNHYFRTGNLNSVITATDSLISLHTSAQERLRITSSGLVGVGTSSPAGRMHVFGGDSIFGATSYTRILNADRVIDFTNTAQDTYVAGRINGLSLKLYANNGSGIDIDSSGRVGVGTTSAGSNLDLAGTASRIRWDVNNAYTLATHGNAAFSAFASSVQSAADFQYQIAGIERARLTASGQLLVGTSSARSNFFNASVSSTLQCEATASTAGSGTISTVYNSNDTSSNAIIIGKTRATSAGGVTVVQSGDDLGFLSYQGADGTELVEAARISAHVDGTPGANDMPGRLVFSTTADGASSPTERMRITQAGFVGIGTTSPGEKLSVAGNILSSSVGTNYVASSSQGVTTSYLITDTSGSNLQVDGAWPIRFTTNSSERARIDSSGRLLVGMSTSLLSYANFQVMGGSDQGGHVCIANSTAAPADGANIGSVRFTNNAGGIGAIIGSEADGAWTAGSNYRSRIVLSTTANGETSPTARLTISAAGLVGIGTTSPGYLLNLVGSVPTIAVQDSGANGTRALIEATNSAVYFGSTYSSSGIPTIFSQAGASGGAERMRIDTSGRVGIGTSAPSYTLDVAGAGRHFSTTTDAASLYLSKTNSGTADQGANKIYFTNAGPAATARASGTLIGALQFQASQPTSGSLQNCGAIEVTADGTQSGVYTPTKIQFSTANNSLTNSNVVAMTIDSSQRVGIGTTSAGSRLEVGGESQPRIGINSTGTGTTGVLFQGAGTTYGSIVENITTGELSIKSGASGQNSYFITFGTNDGSEKARLTSSGQLLVGTSTAFGGGLVQVANANINIGAYVGAVSGSYELIFNKSRSATVGTQTVVANGDTLGQINFQGSDGTLQVPAAYIFAQVDGTPGTNDMPGRLVFSTTADGASSPTERMRIGSDGYLNTFSSANGIVAKVSAVAGTSTFIYAGNRSATNNADGTSVFYVYSNGNVQNTNGSYTTISDVKLKENIVDAGSQWDDLKAIQIRNWNFKVETGHETHRQIGPIAQELETVCPGLVFETPDRDDDGNDLGTVTKGVNQSVLYMKAVKALQEAMERIEQLEQRLTDAGIA